MSRVSDNSRKITTSLYFTLVCHKFFCEFLHISDVLARQLCNNLISGISLRQGSYIALLDVFSLLCNFVYFTFRVIL